MGVSTEDKESRRPELVVFDMAGTTIQDGDGVVARCLVYALASAGVTVSHAAAVALMGVPKPVAIRDLLGKKTDSATVEQVHQTFLDCMNSYYATDPAFAPIAGAEETFAQLRTAGIKVALDTGFSRETADIVIQRLRWQNHIDTSVTSDEVANGRPHPDMIFALMERLDIRNPASVAKIGDTPSDLEQGTAAGCGWVIGVTEGTHTREQLAVYPHTHLVPNVTHILEILGIR